MTDESQLPPDPAYSFAFQPIVNTVERTIIGYEALIRGTWDEPAWQVLNQISPLRLHLFDQTARAQALTLAARLGIDCALHLNFFPQSLVSNPASLVTTLDAAHEAGLPIDRIVFEVPESAVIDDRDQFAAQMKDVRKLGVKLAIDDFGASYVSLNLLADLQPDQIKLDMRLIRGIERQQTPRQAVIRAICQACADLHIDIIAEGVETLAEYIWLSDQNLRLFQGYLFARPSFEAFPPVHFPTTTLAESSAPPARPVAPSRPTPVARSKKQRA